MFGTSSSSSRQRAASGSRLVALLALGAVACCQECDGGLRAVIEAHKANATALKTLRAPPWVSAPDLRGTMDILQTCVVTLVACIYTALHLNVPAKTDGWSTLRSKATWVLLALVAPEIVLYMAADQLHQALRLSRTLAGLQAASRAADKDACFDLSFGFLVVMGGVQVEIPRLARFLTEPDLDFGWGDLMAHVEAPPGRESETIQLTPLGVVELALRGHWIRIRRRKIEDKSKANALQKALVLLQILYMALTCVARLVWGLPVTLLEIHTMVHVLCATALYVFWLKKPLDIHEAEVVYDEDWATALGVMVQKTFYRRQAECLVRYPVRMQGASSSPDSPSTPRILPPSAFDTDSGEQLQDDCMTDKGIAHQGYQDYLNPPLRRQALARLDAVAADLDLGGQDADECQPLHDPLDVRGKRQLEVACFSRTQNLHSLTATNFTLRSIAFKDTMLLLGLLVVLPAIYGGVHLSAWSAQFPTPVEQTLWRVACLIIVATMPSLILALYASKCGDAMVMKMPFLRRALDALDERGHDFQSITTTMYLYGMTIPLAGFALARAFIVVEAFISLRSVPVGAYWSPSWLQMIPHA